MPSTGKARVRRRRETQRAKFHQMLIDDYLHEEPPDPFEHRPIRIVSRAAPPTCGAGLDDSSTALAILRDEPINLAAATADADHGADQPQHAGERTALASGEMHGHHKPTTQRPRQTAGQQENRGADERPSGRADSEHPGVRSAATTAKNAGRQRPARPTHNQHATHYPSPEQQRPRDSVRGPMTAPRYSHSANPTARQHVRAKRASAAFPVARFIGSIACGAAAAWTLLRLLGL